MRRDPLKVTVSLVVAAFYLAFCLRNVVRVNDTIYFTLFDDAMISMRYALNAARGDGLVWNPGAPAVEGYTNFLWTLFMTGLHVLPLPPNFIPVVVSLAGGALVIAAAWAARDTLEKCFAVPDRLAFAAAAGIALSYSLAYWSLRGMEVGLVAAVVTLGARAALLYEDGEDHQLIWLIAACAALPLIRPDAVILSGPLALYAAFARRRWQTAALLFGAIALTLAAHTALRIGYYGDPLPNTYYLKMGEIPLAERLGRGIVAVGTSFVSQLTVALVLILAAARKREPRRWFLLTIVAIQIAYAIYVGGDAWENTTMLNRYLATVLPVIWMLVAIAVADLTEARSSNVRAAAFVAFAALLCFNAVPLIQGASSFPPFLGRANPLRLGFAAACLALAAALVVIARRPMSRRAQQLALLLLVWCGMNVGALAKWAVSGALAAEEDRDLTRAGIELASLAPNRTLAVTYAGSLSYWSRLHSEDALGKSDRYIAKLKQARSFMPGHSKFDLDYTIGQLRPDIVTFALPRNAAYLTDYKRLANGIWIRRGLDIDAARLGGLPMPRGISEVLYWNW